ncbi:MAG: alkyl sulfatase dimerization domain-containing protein [Oscillospiraceae bacterium]
MAKADFDKGEYQWVAEVTNTIVFADPTNTDARLLCADALEQLGYQAESGPWRNEYLTAAQELRHGNANFTASANLPATWSRPSPRPCCLTIWPLSWTSRRWLTATSP